MSCEAFFFSPPIVAREGFLALNVSVLSQAALDTELSPPVEFLQENGSVGRARPGGFGQPRGRWRFWLVKQPSVRMFGPVARQRGRF